MTHWFSRWSFRSESLRHCLFQTVKDGELTFCKNVHPPPWVINDVSHVTCHVSCITYLVLRVRCHHFIYFILFYFIIFFWTNWWSYPVEGLLTMGPTPSSLNIFLFHHDCRTICYSEFGAWYFEDKLCTNAPVNINAFSYHHNWNTLQE